MPLAGQVCQHQFLQGTQGEETQTAGVAGEMPCLPPPATETGAGISEQPCLTADLRIPSSVSVRLSRTE